MINPSRSEKRARVAERRASAIQLHLAGMSWQGIADQLGYASRGAAYTDVTRAMEQRQTEEAEQIALMRYTEARRLDRLQAAAWPAAMSGDVKAVETALKVIDRRVKLFGLDAPRRVSVEAETLAAEITDMLNELSTSTDGD
ncbi:hypothetical protein ACFPA8_27495 [Streptomyces ovatisporus]|uniref:Uncharacterized protein n=1 Tax=Streptomyces ovatisporus TaxID=1128682 RepID=A0ABV9AFV0_9ACTN